MAARTIIIPGVFPSLNEFLAASRQSAGRWSGGNAMKQRDQKLIAAQLPRFKTEKPIWLDYRYYCPNKKRDLDNISGYFHKVFQDALVAKHVIPDDSWRYIKGFSDEFFLDRENPRIEITVRELRGDG